MNGGDLPVAHGGPLRLRIPAEQQPADDPEDERAADAERDLRPGRPLEQERRCLHKEEFYFSAAGHAMRKSHIEHAA